MKTYNKLVRDKIPDILSHQGKKFQVQQLSDSDLLPYLLAKLVEECQETLDSQGEIGELADVLEVVYALAQAQGYAPGDLERIRISKRETRGGFSKRFVLLTADE